jgi:hypothetical protein
VGGEIVSAPPVEQRRNGRAELVEKIAELQALLRIQWNISHTYLLCEAAVSWQC